MFEKAIIVGIGGFIGSVARFLLGAALIHRFSGYSFPIATTVVNLSGCLVIGVLGGLAQFHHLFSPFLRLFLFTGVLGGYTTLSAFGFESFYLLQRRFVFQWALFAGLHIFASVTLVWVGYKLVTK